MPDFIAQLFSPGHWPVFALIAARLSGLMSIAPLWSMTPLPRAARAAIIVVLSVMLLPSAPPLALPESWVLLPIPVIGELVIGLVIGLTAAVVVQGVTLAGEALSVQMGLSLGPSLAPMPDIQVSGLGQLKTMLAVLIYVCVGGHLMLLRSVAESLHTLPPGAALDFAGGGRAVIAACGALYTCALRTAAPVMITLLLSNLGLAMLSRAVPQLNAMLVALPITTAIGLLMFGTALPLVAGAIRGWMLALPSTSTSLLQSLQSAH
jgi:flagellar biosynthetic protein FliR